MLCGLTHSRSFSQPSLRVDGKRTSGQLYDYEVYLRQDWEDGFSGWNGMGDWHRRGGQPAHRPDRFRVYKIHVEKGKAGRLKIVEVGKER